MQNAIPVKDHIELKQRSEKPEIGVAHDGKPERAIRVRAAQVRDQVSKNIHAKFLCWIGSWHARNQVGGEEPGKGACKKEIRSVDLPPVEVLRQPRACDRPQNDCQKCPELDNAITPG